MVLGPRRGPPCPVETPEATRARRAARLVRRRKAAQSGEGIDQAITQISISEKKTIDQQNAVIIDQGRGQMRPRPPKQPKNSRNVIELQDQLKKVETELEKKSKTYDTVLVTFEILETELDSVKVQLADMTKKYQTTSKTLKESLRTTESQLKERTKETEDLSVSNETLRDELVKLKAQLTDVTRQKKVLVDSMEKIAKPHGKDVSAEELAEHVTAFWTERDIIFEEVKSDLSKTRLAKQNAQYQSRLDAEALRAVQDQSKDQSKDKSSIDRDALLKANERVKALTDERDDSLKEIEKLKDERCALIVETMAYVTVDSTLADLRQHNKKLERLLETSNNEVVSGESTILVLEGEKEGLADQLEQMKKEKKEMTSNYQKVTRENGDAIEKLQDLFSNVRSIAGLSKTVSPADSAEKLREAWTKQENRYQSLRKKERKEKSASSKLQEATRKSTDALEQLQACLNLLSEVRSIAGLSENVSPEDSVGQLREAWNDHENRYLKAKKKLDAYGKKKGHVANNKLLIETIENIVGVERGTLEFDDLIEKLQDLDMQHAIKIDNLNAKLEENQKASKEQIQNIRDVCRTTATEMSIKFKKKTKIPEFLALFSSEWDDQEDQMVDLEEERLKKTKRIEELEISLKKITEELEHATPTIKEEKKKKKKLFTKIINKITKKQTSDEKLAKIKDQKASIRRLEAIQDSKYKQDHEVMGLQREANAFRGTIEDLKRTIGKLNETNLELKYSLNQERKIVEGLHDILRVLEERNPMSPRSLPRDDDKVLMDLLVLAKYDDASQDYQSLNLFRDFKPYETKNPPDKHQLSYLASGTFGEVALARLMSSNKCVVVKQPTLPHCKNLVEKHLEAKGNDLRTKKEALIHQLFSENPLIPNLVGLLRMPYQTCLVIDFIGDKDEGVDRTLFDVLKQHDRKFAVLRKKEMLSIAEDFVRATGAFHAKGLLHNDIKTNNILLEKREGRWRGILIDFGQASTIAFPMRKVCSQVTQKKYEAGDMYKNIAPEIIMRGRPSSVLSDIYSLGTVFRLMGKDCCIGELERLGNTCCQDNPAHRPQTTYGVIVKLRTLMTRLNQLLPNHEQPIGNEMVPYRH